MPLIPLLTNSSPAGGLYAPAGSGGGGGGGGTVVSTFSDLYASSFSAAHVYGAGGVNDSFTADGGITVGGIGLNMGDNPIEFQGGSPGIVWIGNDGALVGVSSINGAPPGGGGGTVVSTFSDLYASSFSAAHVYGAGGVNDSFSADGGIIVGGIGLNMGDNPIEFQAGSPGIVWTASDGVLVGVSSINGAPPGGGGSIPTAGISTNQVSAYDGTDTYINLYNASPKLDIHCGAGPINLEAPSVTVSGDLTAYASLSTLALNVSSINGAPPGGSALSTFETASVSSFTVSSINGAPYGGGYAGPTVSTYTYTVPLTLTPGVPTPMFSGPGSPFILTNNHLYSASWNVEWKNEGSGTTPTAGLQFFIGQTLAGDPGNIYSANAGVSGANTNDGANDAFSLTWKQGVTDASTNLYVQMVDVAPLANVSTTITAVGGSLFTLTDWGVFP